MSVKRRCKGCGAFYDFEFGVTTICKYCGTTHVITFNEDTFERIKQANAHRVDGEFEKSIEIYNELIEKHPKSSELRFGRFLAKYAVTDSETLLPDKILTINQTSVFEDDDFQKAIEFELYKKDEYKSIGDKIEERRLVNTKIHDSICKNGYCSMVVSSNHSQGVHYSNELYDKIRNCFDVYYPDVTTEEFSEVDRSVAMKLASDKVKALYVVVDGDCSVDNETLSLVDRFLKTHRKNYLVLITNDAAKCKELSEKTGKVISIDDGCSSQVIEDLKTIVLNTLSEFREFKTTGKKLKDENNPSPIIHL